MFPPLGWRGRMQAALIQRTNGRRSQSTPHGFCAAPLPRLLRVLPRLRGTPSPGFAGYSPDFAGPPPPASPGTPPTSRGRVCRTPEGLERAGAAGRRAPELRARLRIAPQRDHHRGFLRPAVATVRPAVQATAVQQVPQSPLDLAAALGGALPNVSRSVLELDLVVAVPVGLENARHGELHGSAGVESMQVFEAPPHPIRLLGDR